jgi:hypothetical protein
MLQRLATTHTGPDQETVLPSTGRAALSAGVVWRSSADWLAMTDPAGLFGACRELRQPDRTQTGSSSRLVSRSVRDAITEINAVTMIHKAGDFASPVVCTSHWAP